MPFLAFLPLISSPCLLRSSKTAGNTYNGGRMTHRITVNVAPAYEVIVEAGIISRLADAIAGLTASPKVCLVTDSNVANVHLPAALDSLRTRFEVHVCTLQAGEEHKTLRGLERIYDAFLPAGIDRKTPLVALGGGVVGDMTGFAAATILRGVPFFQVPTTLLSMVDASVGGKTGIDHACGKNLIGAFHQPLAVLIDPQTLLTLPRRELAGGLAECIKHDVIRDAGHFAELPQRIEGTLGGDVAMMADLIAHNVDIKARVVEADPHELGERAHLNFGHTFAHSFEKVSKFGYSHGEAVALGMVAASRAAVQLGMLDDGSAGKITDCIELAGLPIGGMKLDTDKCLAAMAFDKKNQGRRIRFVLPDRIGHVVIRDDVPELVVRSAVESLKE